MLKSLELYQVNEKKKVGGIEIPWNVGTFAEDFNILQSHKGFFDLGHWECLEISGNDSTDFIHRLSSQEIKKAPFHSVLPTAFLEGNSDFISLGYLLKLEQKYLYWLPPGQIENTLNHLEKMHFTEEVAFSNQSETYSLIAVYGSEHLPWEIGPKVNQHEIAGIPVWDWQDPCTTSLQMVMVKKAETERLMNHLSELGLKLIGIENYKALRVQSKAPEMGQEIQKGRLFLEADFIDAVNREKGCYPGQEAVERIFTYGGVNQKLMSVKIRPVPSDWECPKALEHKGRSIGELVLWTREPGQSDGAIGFAYIKKNAWEDGPFQIEDKEINLI